MSYDDQGDYYYYLLDTSSLDKYSDKEYKINIWVKPDNLSTINELQVVSNFTTR